MGRNGEILWIGSVGEYSSQDSVPSARKVGLARKRSSPSQDNDAPGEREKTLSQPGWGISRSNQSFGLTGRNPCLANEAKGAFPYSPLALGRDRVTRRDFVGPDLLTGGNPVS